MNSSDTYDALHDFAPLDAWLAHHPRCVTHPWEYVGHSHDGCAVYRSREPHMRLVLRPDGSEVAA